MAAVVYNTAVAKQAEELRRVKRGEIQSLIFT